ncbi:NineTeen Complex (NTC) component [Coemansia erecta]|uniref:NineTeen Complex (NTC) component n=1 Tax=Coemansia erecta TaxID=147472 RepID=A0A9W8CQL3_9FUNG|nr:NineTeen Complex (NTC) component [Coemansia erecta]
MARNQEKAQSMLYRFREAQSIEMGQKKPGERRPYLASSVDNLDEAEKWRRSVISEISKAASKIHDLSLPETQIRDLNDEINKLLRTKTHWETRILELGGPDYKRSGPKMLDDQGAAVRGNCGYRYFGRAKDLPDVKEMLGSRKEARRHKDGSRAALLARIDATYYGYADEDDEGELLEFERQETERRMQKLRNMGDIKMEYSDDSDNEDRDYAQDASDDDMDTTK